MTEFMHGTVDVPGAGKMKKAYVYVPAGLAAVYVGWRWYQAKQEPADAPQGSDGLYTSDDLSDYGESTTGGTGTVSGNTGSTTTDGTSNSAIDDNAEWTQRAVELLGNAGYDGATVYAALGEYLARRALDKNEATIARAAIAAAGQPPIGGPYPVLEEAGANTGTLAAPTNLKATASTASSISMTWDKVSGAMGYRVYRSTGENVGMSLDNKFTATGLPSSSSFPFSVAAFGTTGKVGGRSAIVTMKTADVKLAKPSGLKASAVTKTSFRVTCAPVKGATYYRWTIDGHAGQPTDQPYKDFTGLKANSSHRITVYADTTNQKPGPESGTLTVRTKK